MILLIVSSMFDLISGGSFETINGACLVIHICYFSITSGLSASFIEASIGIFLISIIALVKLLLLGLSGTEKSLSPIIRCVIYGLPILMAAISVWGLIFQNDELKRLR